MKKLLYLIPLIFLLYLSPAYAGEWGKIVAVGGTSGIELIKSAPTSFSLDQGRHDAALPLLLGIISLLAAFSMNSLMQRTSLPFRLAALFVSCIMIMVPVASASMFTGGYTNRGVQEIGHDFITFTFTTTVETTASIHFGKTASLGQWAHDPASQNTHTISITGLDPRTKYYYELVAVDTEGNEERVSDKYYATLEPKPWVVETAHPPDRDPPAITDISVVIPSATTATISWLTDEPANSLVYYDTSSNLRKTEGNSGYTSSHSVTLTDLLSDAIYYYKITSCDTSGNCANSTTKQFRVKVDNQPQFLETSLGTHHNAWTIGFTVKTKPFSELKLYINGEWKSVRDVGPDGIFMYSNVRLDNAASPNIIRIVSTDQNLNHVEGEWQLYPDFDPPVMEILDYQTETLTDHIVIKGTVSELVTLDLTVHPEPDASPPSKATGLEATQIDTNSVELRWDDADESDFMTFILYRDDVRITNTTHTRYSDGGMDSGTTYRYHVSKMDKSCNEGPLSDALAITTDPDGPIYGINATPIDISCNEFTYATSITVSGHFMITARLTQGMNYIKLVATDPGGSKATYQDTTFYDAGAPSFISTNLHQFNNLSYDRDIQIKGVVSEECNLSVYLNDDQFPSAKTISTPTGDPGRWEFSVDLTLSRDVTFEADGSSPQHNWTGLFESASAWENKIQLVCTDRVGLNATEIHTIIYSLCSVGSWWEIKSTQPMPEIITPRLLIQGMAQIGFGINLTWQGSTTYNATVRDVRLVPLTVPQSELEEWDLNWVAGRAVYTSRNKTEAFANIRLKAIDPSRGENWTWIEKEVNISSHRKGECSTVPGFGCIRLPLVIEIDFQTDNPADLGATFTQKECWVPVEIAIDERLDPSLLPESFLKKAVDFLDKFISSVDRVLVPLKTIEKWTVYACLVSWVILFVKAWQKRGQCEIPSALGHVTGSTFKVHIARYGKTACEKKYGDGSQCDDSDACDNCVQCAQAEEEYVAFEQKMQWVCDRVFCPTAPTFKAYVQQATVTDLRPNPRDTDVDGVYDLALYTESMILNADHTITDCDLAKAKPDTGPYYYGSGQTSGSALNDWEKRSEGEIDCTKPHIPNAKCCPTEYMDRWDSVCGLGTGRLFHELKESSCLEAQERRETAEMNKMGCNTVWNSVAGFCDPDGFEPADYVPSNIFIGNRNQEKLYIKMVNPDSPVAIQGNIWLIEAGYVDTKPSDPKDANNVKHQVNTDNLIQTNSYFISLKKGNMQDLFIDQTGRVKDVKEACGESSAACTFCQTLQGEVEDGKREQLHALCKDVHSRIGSGRTEIVDPTSGLLRSAQCLCLPALKSYLSFYRDMAVAVRSCFQTILITGDGDSGMCQSVLTIYICDLVWDLIRCFKKKFVYVPGRDKAGGFGSLVARISGASDDMSNSISRRYGETAPWRAMFSEKKVVHALCLWAFTGTWDLDVTSFFESNYSIPIESQGMLYPCERRFQGFDPGTSPAGRPTYIYHIGAGLVAGAELTNVRLDLQCSNGLCDPAQGFEGGQCDCREETRTINSGWSGINPLMSPGQVLSEDVYVQHTGYRFDKAVLHWTYTNNRGEVVQNNATCDIRKVGPDEPAFCKWSLVHNAYTCDFGGDDECVGYFKDDPAVRPDSNYVGKQLAFDATITHGGAIGENINNECTKFVKVEVKNLDTLHVVFAEQSFIPLNYNGTKTITLPAGDIQEGWLSSSSGARMTSTDNTLVVTAARKMFAAGYYKIRIDETSATCFMYPKNDTTCTDPNPVQKSVKLDGTLVNCDSNQFTVDPTKKNVISDCITIVEGTTSSRGCDTKNPYSRFEATFTIYDAEEYAGSFRVNERSITDYDGSKQEKKIQFSLYCNEADSITSSGRGTDPIVILYIDGSKDSKQFSGALSTIKVEIYTLGRSIDSVEFIKKDSDTLILKDSGLPCVPSTASLQTCTGHHKIQPGTYAAKIVTQGKTILSQNLITITSEVGGTGPTVAQPFYCDGWKTPASCASAEHYLLYDNYRKTIACMKKTDALPQRIGNATFTPGATIDWEESYRRCKDEDFRLV